MSEAPYLTVIREAFPTDDALQMVARQEMTYVMNCTGGRPSDNAWTAARYTQLALDTRNENQLSSPTAISMMRSYLEGQS
jgi:hypothetical protein